MMYKHYPAQFKSLVADFEKEMLETHGADPELFPLFESKDLDSFLTTHKINRIVDLQRKSFPLTEPVLIYGVCHEIILLRLAAMRNRKEYHNKEKSTGVKNILQNIASVTSVIVGIGGLMLQHYNGGRNGKK